MGPWKRRRGKRTGWEEDWWGPKTGPVLSGFRDILKGLASKVPRLEVHLVGGFRDDRHLSQDLTSQLLRESMFAFLLSRSSCQGAFDRLQDCIHLVTFCMTVERGAAQPPLMHCVLLSALVESEKLPEHKSACLGEPLYMLLSLVLSLGSSSPKLPSLQSMESNGPPQLLLGGSEPLLSGWEPSDSLELLGCREALERKTLTSENIACVLNRPEVERASLTAKAYS